MASLAFSFSQLLFPSVSSSHALYYPGLILPKFSYTFIITKVYLIVIFTLPIVLLLLKFTH